jgi:recombination associated protein RdgC
MFKNARFWRFTRPYEMNGDQLAEALQQYQMKPVGPQERARSGWVPIVDDKFVAVSDGLQLVCLRTDERMLPSHVITRYANEKAREIEQERGERIRRREMQEIKEQVELELLPRAFIKTSHLLAFIDPKSGTIVVDSKGAGKAEDLLSQLRRALGSLPVRPAVVQASPRFTMTGWLSGDVERPDEIVPGESCEMHGLGEKGGKVKVKGLDLFGDEVLVHVNNGKQVVSLECEFDGSLNAAIGEDLSLQGVKWLDRIHEKLDDIDADDRAALLYAEFYLTARELLRCFSVLLTAFGGEGRGAVMDEAA